jgi:hypothetical protein
MRKVRQARPISIDREDNLKLIKALEEQATIDHARFEAYDVACSEIVD